MSVFTDIPNYFFHCTTVWEAVRAVPVKGRVPTLTTRIMSLPSAQRLRHEKITRKFQASFITSADRHSALWPGAWMRPGQRGQEPKQWQNQDQDQEQDKTGDKTRHPKCFIVVTVARRHKI